MGIYVLFAVLIYIESPSFSSTICPGVVSICDPNIVENGSVLFGKLHFL